MAGMHILVFGSRFLKEHREHVRKVRYYSGSMKVKALVDWEVPHSVKGVRSLLLGFASF